MIRLSLSRYSHVLVAASLSVGLSFTALGQTFNGGLRGTVTDASGAFGSTC